MSVIKVNNQAWAQLAASISDSDTTIEVADASLFPTLNGIDEYFYGTLVNLVNQIEIVKVTAITGNDLTVERGAEGTTPRPFTTTDRIEQRVTAQTIVDLYTQNSVNAAISEANAVAAAAIAVSSNIRVVKVNGSSTPDALVAVSSPPFGSLTKELAIILEIDHGPNTGAFTVDIDGIGPTPAVRENDQTPDAGDTGGAGAKLLLSYSEDLGKWVHLNPCTVNNRQLINNTINGSKILATSLNIGNKAVLGSIDDQNLFGNNVIGNDQMLNESIGHGEWVAPTAGSTYIIKRMIGSDPIRNSDNDGYSDENGQSEATKIFTQGYKEARQIGGFNVLRTGTVRLTWDMRIDGGLNPAEVRVIKNGSVQAVLTTTSSSYVGKTLDLAVSRGDNVSIQQSVGFGLVGTQYTRNLYVRSGTNTPAVS